MEQKGVFRFQDAEETTNLTAEYSYADEWFLQDARELSPEIRQFSLCLSMAAFPNPKEPAHRQYSNVEALVKELGFSDFEINMDYTRTPADFTIGIFAARKKVLFGEDPCIIYILGFRGASYGKEWYGNTIFGEKDVAYGFQIAVKKTLQFLKAYLVTHNTEPEIQKKVLISGYSRAGAIAGLVGVAVSDNETFFGVSNKDIFVYTFEAPRGLPIERNLDYPNIHNTISRMDMVPLIAPEVWGFCRPGKDDTVLPAPGDEEWERLFPAVATTLNMINPAISCTAEHFTPIAIAGSKLAPIKKHEAFHRKKGKLQDWWYEATLGDYFPRFISFMGKKINLSIGNKKITEREAYARYYEEAFALIAKKYLGAEKDQRLLIRGVLLNIMDRAMKPVQKAILYMILRNGKNKVLRKTASKVTSIIISSLLSKKGFVGTEVEMNEMKDSINKMTYYFLYCASCDVLENDFAYLGTLGANIEMLLEAHAPELIYAWIKTKTISGK